MDNLRVYAGLDYHTNNVQVCVMNPQGKVLENKSCPNDAVAIRDAVQRHGSRCLVALEACNGAANLAEELKMYPDWTVSLAHPFYVAKLKKGMDKSDRQDAEVLADLQRVGYLPKVWLAPEWLRDWRWVVRRRQQLVQQQTQIKLRIRAMLREARVPAPEARPWSKAWLVWLTDAPRLGEQARWVISRCLADLARLQQEINQVQQRLQQWAARDALIQRLLQCPGVGLVTAATLRAELGEFDRFRNGKQLARFIGLSPRNDSSGQRQQTGGLIKAGNSELRSLLVQLAHRLRRLDPRWRAWAQQLQARGKPGSLIAAALANRWTRWLHHEMTKPPSGPTPPQDNPPPQGSAGPQSKTRPPRQTGPQRKTTHQQKARPAA